MGANHLHGLVFELKKRMDSRQDQPVMAWYPPVYMMNVVLMHVIHILLDNHLSFQIWPPLFNDIISFPH